MQALACSWCPRTRCERSMHLIDTAASRSTGALGWPPHCHRLLQLLHIVAVQRQQVTRQPNWTKSLPTCTK